MISLKLHGGGRHLRLGGGRMICVRVRVHIRMCGSMHMVGGLGLCSSMNILQSRCFEITFRDAASMRA